MAVQYRAQLRTALVDAIDNDIGTGGKLKIYTSAYGTLLATWTFTGQMFGNGVTGVITMNAPAATSVTASNAGTAAIAKITTSADVDVITGFTVGTSGTDVVIDNTSITAGQSVSLTYASCTITAPAA